LKEAEIPSHRVLGRDVAAQCVNMTTKHERRIQSRKDRAACGAMKARGWRANP
jgi:hypothetical protein